MCRNTSSFLLLNNNPSTQYHISLIESGSLPGCNSSKGFMKLHMQGVVRQKSDCTTIGIHKTMLIEGMMCPHCQNAVTKALNALEGVSCTVSLEDKAAYIVTDGSVSDDALKQAVIDADYQVISLTDDSPAEPILSDKQGGKPMKKTMIIEGMMCPHCQKAVTKALNDLEGVSATVSLEDKAAYITTDGTGGKLTYQSPLYIASSRCG